MNEERLQKIIEDLKECLADIDECMEILSDEKSEKIVRKLAKSSLRQLFVSYHTILEDLCSIILKEIRRFKIGINLSQSLEVLKEEKILDDELYKVLEKSRLMRNRISHRYKEPSFEDIYNYIERNDKELKRLLNVAESYKI